MCYNSIYVNVSEIKKATKYGVDADKITIINPAVDEKLLDSKPQRKSIENSDILKIISVGRCHWIKGYTFALDAMNILKKEGIQFHYTIIAGGRDHENMHFQKSTFPMARFAKTSCITLFFNDLCLFSQ